MRRPEFLLAALVLIVLAAAPPFASAQPAVLTLTAQPAADGTVQVTAMVTDGDGAPVADTPIAFKVRTAFGWLPLAETSTGADGRANLSLVPPAGPAEITAQAVLESAVQATIRLGAQQTAGTRLRPGRDVLRNLSPQPGFISPYPVPLQVALFGLILGGIWTTYGYVVWRLLGIRHSR